jgi:CHAD domain-containing protein
LSAAIGFACEALMQDLRKDCAEGLQDPKRWHKARLRIKQLRYLIENYQDFLDQRYQDFVTDTRLAQKNLGRLRDWLNLREAMADEPVMSQWLAGHADLEGELTREAATAMDFLQQKLAGWE